MRHPSLGAKTESAVSVEGELQVWRWVEWATVGLPVRVVKSHGRTDAARANKLAHATH